jgi:hypothetical protein
MALLVDVAAPGHLTSGTGLAQECPLTAPLVVRDLHGGFVGQTGTVRTVASDCSFTVARQIGSKTAEPHKHGRLTSDQQKRLGALMTRIELAALPEQLGGLPQPNAHQITVSYGRSRCVLTLAPAGGDPDPPRAPADRGTAWVLDLRDTLKDMIGS